MSVTIDHIPLPDLIAAHHGQEPEVPFVALHSGFPVAVMAVLERTAVYRGAATAWERQLARLECFSVDPAVIQWRVYRGSASTDNGQPVSGPRERQDRGRRM